MVIVLGIDLWILQSEITRRTASGLLWDPWSVKRAFPFWWDSARLSLLALGMLCLLAGSPIFG